MRRLMISLLMLFLTACDATLSERGICDGTREDRKELAKGLVIDGGPISRKAGNKVLTGMKAGCLE